MGQVFTWDAVLRGQVPSQESFRETIETLHRELQYEFSIRGALLCGSMARGDHTVRSDIDCFIVYDTAQENLAFEYMQKATAAAAEKHVPLCFIPCDTALARTRMHHVGGSFLRHLQKSIDAGGLLKGDPLAPIVSSIPEHDELESYLRVKMYNLQESWAQVHTFSEERTAAYLKKLLEAPMHVARKTLAHAGPLEEDSKGYIRARYAQVMPVRMSDMLGKLVQADIGYTQALERHLAAPCEAQYAEMLHRLLRCTRDVLDFVRSNLAYVAAAAR